jgi:hypothetical protein
VTKQAVTAGADAEHASGSDALTLEEVEANVEEGAAAAAAAAPAASRAAGASPGVHMAGEMPRQPGPPGRRLQPQKSVMSAAAFDWTKANDDELREAGARELERRLSYGGLPPSPPSAPEGAADAAPSPRDGGGAEERDQGLEVAPRDWESDTSNFDDPTRDDAFCREPEYDYSKREWDRDF